MSVFKLIAVIAAIVLQSVAGGTCATAEDAAIKLQGATTFASEILEPHRQAIERVSGRRLEMVANKSIWGLYALLEGRADLAMISAPLAYELASARKQRPDLDYDDLRAHTVATTRLSFPVHPSNHVTRLPIEQVSRILTGEIVNWRDVGGADLPIRVVATQEGGGTVAAARAAFLGSKPLAKDAVRLESAKHIVKVVAQEPGAIGIAQLSLIRSAGLNEIVTDRVIEQPLSFVTRGAPETGVQRVIDAARTAAVEARNP